MHKSITVRFDVVEETLIILIHKIKEQFQVQKRKEESMVTCRQWVRSNNCYHCMTKTNSSREGNGKRVEKVSIALRKQNSTCGTSSRKYKY